jgi:DNA polymerase-3 subunit alpha
MAAFFLEDLSGRIEVIAFPEAFRKNFDHLHEDRLVWIKGKFIGEGDSRKVQLNFVMPLADAFQKLAKRMVIRVFIPGLEETILDEVKDVLARHPGECPVFFELETPHAYRVVAQSVEVDGVLPSEELTKTIKSLLGEEAVYVEY